MIPSSALLAYYANLKMHGGHTHHPMSTGYAVGLTKAGTTTVFDGVPSFNDFALACNRAGPSHGSWINDKTNTTWVEQVEVLVDLDAAMRLARAYKQDSIFCLHTGRSLEVKYNIN